MVMLNKVFEQTYSMPSVFSAAVIQFSIFSLMILTIWIHANDQFRGKYFIIE